MDSLNGSDISIRQLEYLVAAVRHESFARAARECFVSQPALSAQIEKLEHTLDVTLFDRHARSVVATAQARALAEHASRILQEVRDLAATARLKNAFRIGAIETVAPALFGPWLHTTRVAHPEHSIVPLTSRTSDLVRDVSQGRLDAAVIAAPDQLSLPHVEIGSEELVVLASAADLSLEAAVQDLSTCDVLQLEDAHCLAAHSSQVCRTLNARSNTVIPGASLATLQELVASRHGVTVIPASHARTLSHRHDLRVIPFREPAYRTLHLVHRDTNAELCASLAALARSALAL
jgi:LysR family hydrogen peroxide-inducible transcriptional activator